MIYNYVYILLCNISGVASEVLLEEMKTAKSGDIDPSSGKIFAYVYTGDGDNFELQQKAYDMFTGGWG